MSNMSYCRFENTYRDLVDCYDNWDEDLGLSESEERSRAKLLRLCEQIVASYADDDE